MVRVRLRAWVMHYIYESPHKEMKCRDVCEFEYVLVMYTLTQEMY